MASRHQVVAPVGQYVPLRITAAGTLIPVGRLVNTTSPTTIAAGVQVVTPASLTNISTGMLLQIINGSGAAEVVQVTAMDRTPGTFTATFANAHSGAYNILSLGGTFLGSIVVNNPGTGCTLQLWNGTSASSPAGKQIAVLPIGSVDKTYNCALDQGLYYTLIVGGAAPDITLMYLDMVA